MLNIDLKGSKVLYIGHPSMSYDRAIINKIEEFGASVISHDLMNFYPDDFLFRVATKVFPAKIEKQKAEFYHRILLNENFNYVLVRHGYQLNENFYQRLKKANPQAVFINFHWDSLKPDYNYLHLIKFFDKIFSFDVKDCRENAEIKYLPLFYLDVYDQYRKSEVDLSVPKQEDLLFIGAWRNKERYDLINKTQDYCTKENLRFKHYLYLSFKRHVYCIKKGIIPKKAKMKELSHKKILQLFSTSNTIIDFPSSFQTGLTIRTFETLGAGKKLITTNKNIIHEPFYDPEFINVIDMDTLTLDIDFIRNKPSKSIDKKIVGYSIGSYVSQLFGRI